MELKDKFLLKLIILVHREKYMGVTPPPPKERVEIVMLN